MSDGGPGADEERPALLEELLAGKHRALARVITKIENRSAGYREIVSRLYEHTGHAEVIGITGSPGAGKSTLVDKMAKAYRDRGETVGVIAVDPSSPYTGGAILGDRIRMGETRGDMDVFFRSMSARGNLGGLSTATADAVKALDAFGKDRIVIETVGAGQNEIDIVRTADTVAVLVPPASGDAVQTLKAGILEIGDVFVVNKADLDGADRTVQELRQMIAMENSSQRTLGGGHGHGGGAHGHGSSGHGGSAHGHGGGWADAATDVDEGTDAEPDWRPRIVETVATDGTGVEELLSVLDDHRAYLEQSGEIDEQERVRYAEEIRTLLRDDASGLLQRELRRRGGIESLVDAVAAGETDPYTIADDILAPIERCLEDADPDVQSGTDG